jgi:choline dehydrogenase-like flavoprotein
MLFLLPATNSLLAVGTIRLNTSNPFDFPLMDPNFLSTEFDQFTMLYAVKAARRFVQASPWADFITGRFGVAGSADGDEAITAAIRAGVVTIWHPTSTARMSPKGANFGVVDPDLLVKGVSGLRIVDASVFVSRLSTVYCTRQF